MWRLLGICLLALTLHACLDFLTADPCARFAGEQPCPTGLGPNDLQVRRTIEYLHPTGNAVVHRLEATVDASVLVLDGGAWSQPILPSRIDPDAGYLFTELPEGLRLVRLHSPAADHWFEVSGNSLDYGHTELGRADAVEVPAGSRLTVSWPDAFRFVPSRTISLESTSPMQHSIMVGVDAGSATFEFTPAMRHAAIQAQDTTYLQQAESVSIPARAGGAGGAANVMVRGCRLPASFAMVTDGGPSTSGCVPATGTATLELEVRYLEYVALAKEMSSRPPAFIPVSIQLFYGQASTQGAYAALPGPATATVFADAAPFTLVALSTFGGHLLTRQATVLLSAPVDTSAGTLTRSISARSSERSQGSLVSPRLGAVRAPRLGAVGIFDGGSHRGDGNLTPTLSWLPPAVPAQLAPTSYRVELFEVRSLPSPHLKAVASFVLLRPELHVPPGIFLSGRQYVAVVEARRSEIAREHPWRVSLSHDKAQLLTDAFVP